jgi:hypothetical protein
MPKKTNVKARPGNVREGSEKSLYLGCFYFDEIGEEEYSGTFQMLARASDPEAALDLFRIRMRKLRTTSDLFDNPVTIYLDGVLDLAGSFENAVLVNYRTEARDEVSVTVSNILPMQSGHEVLAHEAPAGSLKEAESSKDGQDVVPFVDFGGFAFRKAVERAKNPARQTRAVPAETLPAAPPSPLTYSRTKSRSENAAAMEEKKRAQEERHRKKEQRKALSSTLAELRASNKQRSK